MANEGTPHSPITIQAPIGARVLDCNGEDVGEFARVVVDARSDQITEIVVRHGTILHNERLVPLEDVISSKDDSISLSIDKDAFEEMPEFDSSQYGTPGIDYSGPPGWDAEARNKVPMAMETVVAFGAKAYLGGSQPVAGYVDEAERTTRTQRPIVGEGTPILASDGEQVGEVSELEVDINTGDLGRLVVKEGFLFPSEAEIPAGWIEDIADGGVLLNVPKSEVESLLEREG